MATTTIISQTAAQASLTTLEQRFRTFHPMEQAEIDAVRDLLRKLIMRYSASAELAIIAVGFEIAIKEKQ